MSQVYAHTCSKCRAEYRDYYSFTNQKRLCPSCFDAYLERIYLARIAIKKQWPTMHPRLVTALGYAVSDIETDVCEWVASLSDAAFLGINNMGPKLLVVFRAVVPVPVRDELSIADLIDDAVGAYMAEHSTCDIQAHPWVNVYWAGFAAGWEARQKNVGHTPVKFVTAP